MSFYKKYKSLIDNGILLVIAIVFAIIVLLSFTNFLGNSSMPNVAVSTYSMMPIYKGFQDTSSLHPLQGDILLVRKVPISSLEVGDVIIFDTPSVEDPVVHRIIAKWQNSSGYFFFKTNGDNKITNKFPDPWIVHENEVIGKVVIRIPHIGWLVLTIQQTMLGKIFVLLLAVFVLFGEDILKFLGIIEKKNEDQASVPNNKKEADKNKKKKFRSIYNVIRKRESIYVFIGVIILFIFTFSNFMAGFSDHPSINIYKINDFTGSNSLLTSSHDSLISISPQGQWTELIQKEVNYCPGFEVIEDFPQKAYFYPILIQVKSGGFFNNINYFEIRVNQIQGLYRWTIVNNFIGTHTISGGIISLITGEVDISIHLYSRGLFASKPQIMTFPLFLQG